MKIELEIGYNLRLAIEEIVDECERANSECQYPQLNPGYEVRDAFGINFVELVQQNPKLKNITVEITKRL